MDGIIAARFWRIRPALLCPAQGSWLEEASVYGRAQQWLRGMGVWAMRYPSSTCSCHLRPSALGLGVSTTAGYLQISRVSSGNEQGRSQQAGKEEEGGEKQGLGSSVPPIHCRIRGNLALTSLRGRGTSPSSLINRGSHSEHQVGCHTLPGPLPPWSDICKHRQGLYVAEPKHHRRKQRL